MFRINHLYNNSLFKAGVLIGSGVAFIISGTIMMTLGYYSLIKYGFEK